MEADFFKNKIKNQYIAEGITMYENNTSVITDGINHGSSDIHEVTVASIERGKFYFMFYDINGKSTKMEKFNPLFVLDWFDLQGTRMLYAVSINFMPLSIRTVFFNNLCNYNLSLLDQNQSLDYTKQIPFPNINFTNIYKLLYNIGFEWTIRQFDMRKINKVFNISTNVLDKFITMSTMKLTGVDDGKLMEIWHKKIIEQDVRHKKILKEILEDYSELDKELTKTYMTLETRNNNLQESLNIINNL